MDTRQYFCTSTREIQLPGTLCGQNSRLVAGDPVDSAFSASWPGDQRGRAFDLAGHSDRHTVAVGSDIATVVS